MDINITLVILAVYLAAVFFIAWFFSRNQSLEAYFVNKRKTSVWLMTFSTVATIVGAGSTVAVIAEVYNTGISFGVALPISLIIGMFILGMIAKKIKIIGDEYGAHTIVDFFEKRFDRKNRNLTGILQLFILVTLIGVQAIAVSSLASVLVGIDYKTAVFLTAAVTILYTSIGGLRVDIIADFVQFWVIMLVFFVISVIGYQHVGSFSELISGLPPGHLDLFAFGGATWFVGVLLVSGFLHLGNTIHWQRIFAAESDVVARKSFFLAMPITAILSLIILFLGLVSAVSLPQIPKENALFFLMYEILPPWAVGIGFAAVLAVIMSTIDSMLIGGSTIIYKAVFKNKELEEKKSVFYARIFTALFGIFGFTLAYLIPNIVTLFLFVSYLALVFVPPIYAGLYSQKTSANASFYSILASTVVLFALFPFSKETVFIISTLLGVAIVILYDRVFTNSRKKNMEGTGSPV
ncbi:MAG: sodium:solute symporter family protein [Patescibacteria group bacterium]